ncbi:flagellar biosynthetic protein FliQ [Desulfotomaculum nigrificans CO-1-SRB]|uniref:Flagellar biosynthetic protein FliQ n=1 Tax=Desulfotomaculum nigrificans (strain DSM 14880 / VKM B-2319 / CO-1-SRB) TaxID=868595 RepID=F6B7Z5_DESCC|nr:flagellar biosynthesis protein FliQ [Desulfotomaculum nigrificans]AEF94632.1 flagellar biosynthetic protein FliQ [Desulfotomaculum nigrificans CO-1-SRB]
MTETFVIHVAREALMMVVILSLPALGVAMLVGLIISILQATTQIQEQTLSFVPKMVAVFVTLLIAASWLLNIAVNFTTRLYQQIPNIVR